VPRIPTAKMKELSRLLRDVGHEGITAWTAVALDLHDYQYHGPDPDMALSKYTTRKSAAADVVELLQELTKRIETLKGRVSWTEELEKSLEEVKGASARWMQQRHQKGSPNGQIFKAGRVPPGVLANKPNNKSRTTEKERLLRVPVICGEGLRGGGGLGPRRGIRRRPSLRLQQASLRSARRREPRRGRVRWNKVFNG